MKVENPVALRFILQDELYLLKADKAIYENLAVPEPEIENIALVAPIIKEVEPPLVKLPEPVTVSLAPEVKTPVMRFNYLGKNLKRFLVLVHYPQLEFIDDSHLAALANIIKRKDLSLDDIVIVNLALYATAQYDDLVKFFKPAKLLVLGKNALPPGIAPLTLNAPKPLGDIAGLYSFSFGEMMDNVEYKKAFWEQVKSF
ncbi:hypothetical protein [Mucilaginibacter sp. FT3.2]|uniref:hypothetical protein n=1 Tax=Mucilaginibacter sp. FT3.2 TaxID=2723090 RepID=UPI001609645E|nr:hypothetical protein [Mucilaginibacter sp. FT3.2]MBB6230746.1 hypothetical protein [Mucilaginibacter sp. FT3.2]